MVNIEKLGGVLCKVALLIIDMQKGCKEETPYKDAFNEAVMYINEISGYFRKKEYPVVIVKDLSVGEVGSDRFEFIDEIDTLDNDIVVHKNFNNAFWETELDNILREKDIEAVIISGFAAEYCVLFTYGGAVERGYETFLLQNGIAGMDLDEIKKIQLLRPVISYKAIEYFC